MHRTTAQGTQVHTVKAESVCVLSARADGMPMFLSDVFVGIDDHRDLVHLFLASGEHLYTAPLASCVIQWHAWPARPEEGQAWGVGTYR